MQGVSNEIRNNYITMINMHMIVIDSFNSHKLLKSQK